MLPDIPPTQLAAALDEVVLGLLAAGEMDGPPVDAFRVADAIGVLVARDDGQSGRARYVRLAGQPGKRHTARDAPSILIRSDPRPERRQWAVAHELGEHLAHEVFARLAVDPIDAPPAAREAIANYLASRLLLPTHWFSAISRTCDWALPNLKEAFVTASNELIARRMLDFEPAACISIYDHGRLTCRWANRPGRPPPPTFLERECQLAAHQSGKTVTKMGELLRVRAWPIHEPDWKREILRCEAPNPGFDGC
ncbi:MAG TPA: ImmA/IrrE family metallo-endopeptidase [Pirellulales bacterium]|jgi:Zn-dependent peptidase ImmA (M78 family)|nr:ImmA/IrrE family metallo-endopeptidase [Pirellulales bacterium]